MWYLMYMDNNGEIQMSGCQFHPTDNPTRLQESADLINRMIAGPDDSSHYFVCPACIVNLMGLS